VKQELLIPRNHGAKVKLNESKRPRMCKFYRSSSNKMLKYRNESVHEITKKGTVSKSDLTDYKMFFLIKTSVFSSQGHVTLRCNYVSAIIIYQVSQ
jgi:hypothetical protein